MTGAPTTLPGYRQMRVSDPELPLIVSRAAIEFDSAIQGKPVEFAAARRLADFLSMALDCSPGEAGGQRNLDVTVVGIVGQALRDPGTNRPVTTVADVVQEAITIVKGLAEPRRIDAESQFLFLLEFCVAFGNGLIAKGALVAALSEM